MNYDEYSSRLSGDTYESLTIKNNFMFGKVMEEPENCVGMLERLTGNTISDDIIINSEKAVKIAVDGKGVRYDVHVQEASKNMYDAEMQQIKNKLVLPKRSRFYQELMDFGYLESGADYASLPDSYAIFICTFDPFGRGLCCYSFENVCVDMPDGQQMRLGDGRKILMFNTKGKVRNVSNEAWNFLNYTETGEAADEYTKRLDASVSKARKNKEWRAEYMKNICHEADLKREGHEEGIKEGIKEGHKLGVIETAHNLKAMGTSVEFIMEATGLSKEEIEKL